MANASSIVDMLTKADKYKSQGQIVFRMTNFKAFSEGNGGKSALSDTVEYINELPWRIRVDCGGDWLGIFLCCDVDPNDMAWSCRATFHFSIVSRAKRNGSCLGGSAVFAANFPSFGWPKFVKFEELMDLTNGFYDEKLDAVTFKAVVTPHRPRGMREIRTGDPLLINDIMVYVNKHLLSAFSEFFRNLFFGPMAEEMPSVRMFDVENAVEKFERLIATMPPQNLELDDDCVEGVLHLANRFLMDFVENRCVEFLMAKSKKSALCKFCLANQYGIVGMAEKVLKTMTWNDFCSNGENFYDIFSELDKLDADGARALRSRHKEIFGTKAKNVG